MKKNINLTKGLTRLTIVLSIITGIGFLLSFATSYGGFDDPIVEIPLSFSIGFVLVWLVYFFIKYIVVKYIIGGFRR